MVAGFDAATASVVRPWLVALSTLLQVPTPAASVLRKTMPLALAANVALPPNEPQAASTRSDGPPGLATTLKQPPKMLKPVAVVSITLVHDAPLSRLRNSPRRVAAYSVLEEFGLR